MQIIAQKYSNPTTPSTHPSREFLFCSIDCELSRRAEQLRANLAPDDTPRRAASFARNLAEVLRRRHLHVSRCSACILREVFEKPNFVGASKAVAHG
jgi:hypothetical protein